MSDNRQKYAGTRYTTTAALLIVAFVFSPAFAILSGSSGAVVRSLAPFCSVLCIALAWLNWKRYSELTILSIATPNPRSK